MKFAPTSLLLAGLVTTLAACGSEGMPALETYDLGIEVPTDERYEQNGGLRWGANDDPSIFDDDLELRLTELPMSGEAATAPWAGNYWPTYQDSLNYKWDGADSDPASTKYAKAFDVEGVEDKISRYRGIARYTDRTECENDDVCDSDLAETCAKRDGEEKGRCIPTWWGICHAWAPASILEPEPINPVTHNGVEFKVQDIKALVSLMYDRVETKFVSLRCNENDGAGEIEYDKYGRPTGPDAECLDTNPGTWHVIVTNYLGLRQQSFVEDRTFDYEVWNQPMRSFEITKLDEIDFAQANDLVGVKTEGGEEHKRDGNVKKDAWEHLGSFDVRPGTNVSVVMTGTNDADLYVRWGKEPAANGYDCRPYVGGSSENCDMEVPADVEKVFVSVHGYDDDNDFDLTITLGGETPTEYRFNDTAKQFYHVKMTSRYIAESPASRDGNLSGEIDRYTHNDYYEYVLEIGDEGRIEGGEWIGASKKAHPDFLWLPSRRRYDTIAYGALRYSNVKQLLDASIAGTDPGGDEETVVEESGTLARDAWNHFGPFDVQSGALEAVLAGTGDADLYVRSGSQPTTRDWDCRPYVDGSSEACTVDGPGQIYVSVRGYATSSTYQLRVTFGGGDGGNGGDGGGGDPAEHLNENGTVTQGQSKFFTVPVTAGQAITVQTTGPGDIDLYIKMGQNPSTGSYDQSSTSWTGNESITYTPAADGVLHVLVYGYGASSFTLTSSN